ncbi:hypothetical protein N7365_11360 [Pseudomonas sediminis]|uniref:hypothetical protein n=1 Tax=Pseudomonas sediminis TaxID=1691904 RepID=UPI0024491E12|nr:hypothetical protein [Pseudomonas sediminis]MDG9758696.1 hypothetical protein [Pseudomonas sediminis]
MKARIRYTSDRLPEMELDFPMNEPQDVLLITVSRCYDPVSGLPMRSMDGQSSASEVWVYRLAGYLRWAPEVPCYQFSKVLSV